MSTPTHTPAPNPPVTKGQPHVAPTSGAPPPPPKNPPAATKPAITPSKSSAQSQQRDADKLSDRQKLVETQTTAKDPRANRYKDYHTDQGSNPEYDWLTYESVYNYAKFEHTKYALPMGAYTIPMKHLRIIVSSTISDARLEQIRQAIFPNTVDLTQLKTLIYKPWTTSVTGAWNQESVEDWESTMKRANGVAHMPYNIMANNRKSQALGTRDEPTMTKDLNQSWGIAMLEGEWPMWQTASRSCVIRLDSTDAAQPSKAPRPQDHDGQVLWNFSRPEDSNVVLFPAASKGPPHPEVLPKTPFGFFKGNPTQWERCYGVKTGVAKVGQDEQTGKETGTGATMGGKGTLEKESIAAALRSEYLHLLQKIVQRSNGPAAQFIDEISVLPEVLTVTCTNEFIDLGACDGFQLRDISGLLPSNKYFPPISIPFVDVPKVPTTTPPSVSTTTASHAPTTTAPKGPTTTPPSVSTTAASTPTNNFVDFAKYAAPWSAITDQGPKALWVKFWDVNFARRIGRAKAILHMVYGLQCLTPNSQNFLLEFDKSMVNENGRTVLRDVLDMKLHSDWVQTVMGAAVPSLVESLTALWENPKILQKLQSAVESDNGVPGIGTELHKLLTFEATVRSPIWDATRPHKRLLYESENSHHSRSASNAIQYFKGTQLNFVNYTALFKGSWVDTQPATAPGETRPKNWQWVLHTNIQWAYIHAEAYISFLKTAMPSLRTVQAINIDTVTLILKSEENANARSRCGSFLSGTNGPLVDAATADEGKFDFRANLDTIENLTNSNADYTRAGQLDLLFLMWERAVSDEIHNALYGTQDSRRAVRQFFWGDKSHVKL